MKKDPLLEKTKINIFEKIVVNLAGWIVFIGWIVVFTPLELVKECYDRIILTIKRRDLFHSARLMVGLKPFIKLKVVEAFGE